MGQFVWEEDEQDTEIVFGILNIEFYPLNCLSRLPSSIVSYLPIVLILPSVVLLVVVVFLLSQQYQVDKPRWKRKWVN
jgi:hypothetical protein